MKHLIKKQAPFLKRIIAICLVFLMQATTPTALAFAQDATASASTEASASSSVNLDLGPTEEPSTPSPTLVPTINDVPQEEIITSISDISTPSDTDSSLKTPPPISGSSGILSSMIRVRNLSKRNYQSNERIPLYVEQGREKRFQVRVTDRHNKTVHVSMQEVLSGTDRVITMFPPSSLAPGKYTVEISDNNGLISTQSYLWGVLAINPDQYQYKVGDTSTIAMAVLNDAGEMVCDADVTLTVISPSGQTITKKTTDKTIIVNPQCSQKTFSLIPDYETTLPVSEKGKYALQLTATVSSGTYMITDAIEGVTSTPFMIKRTAPTRLYPPLTYPMHATITASEDFSGVITEVVPNNFVIAPPLDKTVLAYTDISPAQAESLQNEFSLSPNLDLHEPFTPLSTLDATSSASPSSVLGATTYPISLGFSEQLIDTKEKDFYAQYGLAGHDGIDFEMDIGTPIAAIDEGTVLIARKNFDYGTTIILEHSWGRSYYGHLSTMLVQEGDNIKKGQHIADSGNTGITTGPHLHFGLRPNNFDRGNGYMGKINPAPYLGLANQQSVLGASSDAEEQVQVVSWNVSMKKGESITLGYQFMVPGASPMLYTIGPLRFFDKHDSYVFSEGRRWQLAVDAPPPYRMTTGRYVGSGNYKQISGLGFRPEAVMVKASNNAGAGAWLKTSSMIDNSTARLDSAAADDTSGTITLDEDGFTVITANANTANTSWVWVAWSGSDCSASGQFCVGDYLGDGSSPRKISTGFQPDIAIVKRTTNAVAANFQTVGMTANYGQYFMATPQDTTGALFGSLQTDGFQVGATNNTSAGIYHFIAFKITAGSINVGSFTGNAPSSQTIGSLGFDPNLVIVKNTTGTAVSAVFNVDYEYGNSSSYFTDTANVVDSITALGTGGANNFSVGSHASANDSGQTMFWMAFQGKTAPSSSGTFKMASGSYSGNGAYQTINGLGFAPDLVIIKGGSTAGVFRTTQHNGDVTSYLDAGTADFALGIQSLNPDGFTIGSHATVNTNGTTYYWTAYGNAWRVASNSGASDFVVGTYYGNGKDDRNITGMPFSPSLVAIKAASGSNAGVFRTSSHGAGNSSFYAATADNTDRIQAFNSDGFQIGTNANVNSAGVFYRYFAFAEGPNFDVGTYTGNGTSKDITTGSPSFQPDNIWIKKSDTTAAQGVERTGTMDANSALPFIASGNVNNAITAIGSSGFTVGSAAETNTDQKVYWYAAWRIPGTINISGNIYQANETTPDTTAYSVYISVANGSPVAATVPGDGTYSYTALSVSSGSSIAVYIYNNANDANTFTVTDGSTNITGLNLIVGKVVVGNNNSGSTTNANICNQSSYPTASTPDDRLFSCSSNDITAESGVEWHILQNNSYVTGSSATLTTQGSGGGLHVDDGASATFSSTGTIADAVAIDSGATLTTASSNTLNVVGNWTNAGTFTPNSGTVNFTGADSSTQAVSGNTTFNNLGISTENNTTGRTIQFAGSSANVVVGTWTVTGFSGKVLTLQSSNSNNWTINPTNASVTYVNVSRSTNSGTSFCATYSTDGNYNSGWNISTGGSCASGPTQDQLMRHGQWFNTSGVEQPFTF